MSIIPQATGFARHSLNGARWHLVAYSAAAKSSSRRLRGRSGYASHPNSLAQHTCRNCRIQRDPHRSRVVWDRGCVGASCALRIRQRRQWRKSRPRFSWEAPRGLKVRAAGRLLVVRGCALPSADPGQHAQVAELRQGTLHCPDNAERPPRNRRQRFMARKSSDTFVRGFLGAACFYRVGETQKSSLYPRRVHTKITSPNVEAPPGSAMRLNEFFAPCCSRRMWL